MYDGITGYKLSGDGSAIACRVGNRLRVIPAKRDPSQGLPSDDRPSRRESAGSTSRASTCPSSRVRVAADAARGLAPAARPLLGGGHVGRGLGQGPRRYEPLVERVACRSEFSDLMWEMQGELGTSHAYEMGGDYRPSPHYQLGFLGADLAYDAGHDAYRLTRILKGDVWDDENAPPLKRPGVNVEEGMLLLAIGGQRVSKDQPPNELLVNLAGKRCSSPSPRAMAASPRTVVRQGGAHETAAPLPGLGGGQPAVRPRKDGGPRGLCPRPRHGRRMAMPSFIATSWPSSTTRG